MRSLLLGSCVVALIVAFGGSTASAVSTCSGWTVTSKRGGPATYYTIRVIKGHRTCADAQRVLKRFLGDGVTPAGYRCTNSAGTKWVAGCTKGGNVFRAYRPTKPAQPVPAQPPVCGIAACDRD